MSFWATTLPYTDPGQLKGGIRTRDAVLRNLQADAFRSASQNQVTDQVANSRSGAAATNTRAATAEISQAATALNQKNIQLESHEQVLRNPLANHVDNAGVAGAVITTATDLNTLINSDNTPGANTANASSINGDEANDAHVLVPGDDINITGTEFDGTAITAATFVYGAANNGTTVGDLINFINGTGIGTGGGTDKFTTATMDLIGPGDVNNGKLRLVSDNGGPGMLSIDLDTPDAHIPTGVSDSSTTTVQEVATSDTNASGGGNFTFSTTGGTVAATAGTDINILDQVTGSYVNGDTIAIGGTDADGNAVNGTFTFGNGVGQDGTTLGDLRSRIETIFDGATEDVGVVLSSGRFVMTADNGRAIEPADLDFTLADGTSVDVGIESIGSTITTEGRNPFLQLSLNGGAAFAGGDDLNTLSIVDNTNPLNTGDEISLVLTDHDAVTANNSSVDFVYGTDGTTVNDLITFLSANGFGGETITINTTDNTLDIEAPSDGASQLSLTIRDEGKHLVLQDFTGPPSPDLLRLNANTEQSEFLARGSAHIAQNQGGNQDAFAQLNNFAGADSTSFNSLNQNAQVTQSFDVDLTTTVLNCTLANNFGAFHGARFRELYSTDDNNAAQAIFTNGQRQGSAAERILQNAIANGADADNTRTMTATLSQTGDVRHTGIIDMTRKEQVALTPRGVDILARYAANSAQNTSAASQEQNQAQSAISSADDSGRTTENGGTAQNLSTGNLLGIDAVTVANIGTMML
ncbi:MAG: hypothetical protein O3B01_21635 [Planctomycetota bacterium]|nr:hypothetical protein [Planctomycetota bacterium]